jgi:hypothetical protein
VDTFGEALREFIEEWEGDDSDEEIAAALRGAAAELLGEGDDS